MNIQVIKHASVSHALSYVRLRDQVIVDSTAAFRVGGPAARPRSHGTDCSRRLQMRRNLRSRLV